MAVSTGYDEFHQLIFHNTSGDATNEEERRAIVAMYDRGKEEGFEVPKWENPDLDLYKCQDRYGFMHTKPIVTEVPHRIQDLERERSEKWGKMLKQWEKYEHSDKMYKRIYKGIPQGVRGTVWKRFLNVDSVKEQGVYDKMKSLAREVSPSVKQIDKDVLRTFRDNITYWMRYNIKQQQLFHVLAAYSVYNPVLGYCQGMSSLVAMLLMYLDEEEDAFWALVTLTSNPKYAMHGFFIPGFPKLFVWFENHDRSCQKCIPKLNKHFRKRNIDPSHYCTGWFFKLFLDTVPFQVALRIWDAFLLEGQRVLVSAAVALLKVNKKQLLGLDEDDCRIFLQQISERGMDEEAFISELQSVMGELHKAKLDVPQAEVDKQLQDIKTLTRVALSNLERYKSSQKTVDRDYTQQPQPHNGYVKNGGREPHRKEKPGTYV
jgi:hypothetical protein